MVFFDLSDDTVLINYKAHEQPVVNSANVLRLHTDQAYIKIDASYIQENRMKLSRILKYL